MKNYLPHLLATSLAFLLGIGAVWIYFFESFNQDLNVVPEIETSIIAPLILPKIEPNNNSKPEQPKPVSIAELRPSSGYWGQDFKPLKQVSKVTKNRKLVAIGDTLHMLDDRNLIVWTWTTGGAPLTDFPVIDSEGIIHAIAYDLTWVAIDSESGEKLWQGTANGRAVYSQIELYKKDMYLVVVDMSGYDYPGEETNDILYLCKGNSFLWNTEIPARAKIQVRKGNVYIKYKQKKKTVLQKLKIPRSFDKPLGKIDGRSKYN